MLVLFVAVSQFRGEPITEFATSIVLKLLHIRGQTKGSLIASACIQLFEQLFEGKPNEMTEGDFSGRKNMNESCRLLLDALLGGSRVES